MVPGSRQGEKGAEMAKRSREQGLQSSPPGRGAGKVQEMWKDRSREGGKGQAMKDGT